MYNMTTTRITRENERPLTLCEITNEILSGYSGNHHLPNMIKRERIENYDFGNTTDIVFDPSLVNLSVEIDKQYLYGSFNENGPTADCVESVDDGWNDIDIINCDISGVSFTHGFSSDVEEHDKEEDDEEDDYPYYPEDYITGAEYFERCLWGY